MKVIIVGGGWAGTAAAVSAVKLGAEVVLLERADMLLGTGLVGGIMKNNGRFTATEECIALGAPEIFTTIDENVRHKNIEFPGHKHAWLYDVSKIEPAIKKVLKNAGIEIKLQARVTEAVMEGTKIKAVKTADGQVLEGDVFLDTTGTFGPQGNCTKYGNGCAMCILRCPTFGPRVSLAGKAGVKEMVGRKADDSIGAMSGSCKLNKDSLSPEIVEKLDSTGVCVVPIPEYLQKKGVLEKKACQQYALKEFSENVILLDTGHAKLMTPFYPLESLRQIPGFENARYEDPYAGGIGNSMRYFAISPRSNQLKVDGVDNLFCGGEKTGLLVGHTEAIVTGTLAGHNAARYAMGSELLTLPDELAIGDAIAYVGAQMKTEEGLRYKYTFSGSVYFDRMKEKGLYTTNIDEIRDRVEKMGLTGIFASKDKAKTSANVAK